MTGGSEDLLVKGQRIDRYEIREHIGQGGMGAVYRAIDSKLGRTVALKTVVPQHAGAQLTEAVRQRFLREALAIARVADIVMGVCAALRACHHADIVHRDLKPSNVFLADTDTGWEVKVLD